MNARLFSALALISIGASSLAGCEPDRGTCDARSAIRPAWDDFGSPAYEGQAMLLRSCGFAALCHAADVPVEYRYGVPMGLDWDLRVVADSTVVDLEEVERLRDAHERAYGVRFLMWAAVDSGRMPIRDGVGEAALDGAPEYFRRGVDGALEPIPEIGSSEGRAIFRNWLACGLPVVERSEPAPATPGYTAAGAVVSEEEVEPLEATWTNIYTRLIEPRCATLACHGAAVAGDLDLRDQTDARLAMIDVVGTGEECEDVSLPLIAPGDPDGSLLVQKLEGRDAMGAPICGRAMPIGGSRVSEESMTAIRAWITAGAMP
jgi:hypothetical protein